MKHSMLWVLVTLATILSSCGNNPTEYPQSETIEDQLWLAVIRYTSPSYKENILAVDNSMYRLVPHDDSVFYACRTPDRDWFIEWTNEINLLATSPYIELVDGYLMIDWKWRPVFRHCSDKINGNYGHTILTQLKWTDLTDFTQEWERTIPNDHEAIDRIHHFKVKALDDYRGDQTYITEGWEKHIMHCGTVEQIDSLQNIYAECLRQVLRDHDYNENESFILRIY